MSGTVLTAFHVLICFLKWLILYWGSVDYRCGDSFRCPAEWLGDADTRIGSFSNSFPVLLITEYWAEFPELPSRSLRVLHVKHSRVSMSIPDSLTVPSPILPSGDHQVITECWAEFPGLDSGSLLVLHSFFFFFFNLAARHVGSYAPTTKDRTPITCIGNVES